MMRRPPTIDAAERGCPVRSQSTMATRKMVRRAATDERTGDVREMRTRKHPEKAGDGQQLTKRGRLNLEYSRLTGIGGDRYEKHPCGLAGRHSKLFPA
jgi:hypothetical protein